VEIKNLMEGLVLQAIDQLKDEKNPEGTPRYCTNPECTGDAACYVLNRITPRYAGSSRGVARLTRELQQDSQLQIDILRLVTEALHRVTAVQRDYQSAVRDEEKIGGPYFNFPTVRGRLLNGMTFEPVTGVSVELFSGGDSTEMFDGRWQNPYEISDFTPGTFLFWPAPIPAERPLELRTFSFEIRVTDGMFDPFRHLFRVEIQSDETEIASFSLHREYLLPDLYLFPR